ncbi:MAG: Ig-like domain-containing protein [Myxococcales bacterium]
MHGRRFIAIALFVLSFGSLGLPACSVVPFEAHRRGADAGGAALDSGARDGGAADGAAFDGADAAVADGADGAAADAALVGRDARVLPEANAVLVVAMNGSGTVTVLGDDPAYTVSGAAAGIAGTPLVVGARSILYTPNADYHGTDSFSFTFQDGSGAAQAGTVAVKVMTPYTWTGAGAEAGWSVGANWCGAVVGGACAGAAGPPGPADTAIFDGTCSARCSATLDLAVEVAGLEMNAGFTGALAQAGGVPVHVGALGWTQESGAFVGGTGPISISGGLQLLAGSFTSTSGTLTVGSKACGTTTAFRFGAAAAFGHAMGTFVSGTGRPTTSSCSAKGVLQIDADVELWDFVPGVSSESSEWQSDSRGAGQRDADGPQRPQPGAGPHARQLRGQGQAAGGREYRNLVRLHHHLQRRGCRSALPLRGGWRDLPARAGERHREPGARGRNHRAARRGPDRHQRDLCRPERDAGPRHAGSGLDDGPEDLARRHVRAGPGDRADRRRPRRRRQLPRHRPRRRASRLAAPPPGAQRRTDPERMALRHRGAQRQHPRRPGRLHRQRRGAARRLRASMATTGWARTPRAAPRR